MSNTTTTTRPNVYGPIAADRAGGVRPPSPISPEQRVKLSAAQRAYVANDPRWAKHRQKLADAQTARRMTLTPEEVAMVLAMRAKGRTFSYIQEEIGVCHDVIRRELAGLGYSTARIGAEGPSVRKRTLREASEGHFGGLGT